MWLRSAGKATSAPAGGSSGSTSVESPPPNAPPSVEPDAVGKGSGEAPRRAVTSALVLAQVMHAGVNEFLSNVQRHGFPEAVRLLHRQFARLSRRTQAAIGAIIVILCYFLLLRPSFSGGPAPHTLCLTCPKEGSVNIGGFVATNHQIYNDITIIITPDVSFSITPKCLRNILRRTPPVRIIICQPFMHTPSDILVELEEIAISNPDIALLNFPGVYANRYDFRNEAIKLLDTKYAVFLTNDVFPRHDHWLHALHYVAETTQTGAIGVDLYTQGTTDDIGLSYNYTEAGIEALPLHHVGHDKYVLRPRFRPQSTVANGRVDNTFRSVFYVNDHLMLIAKDVLDTRVIFDDQCSNYREPFDTFFNLRLALGENPIGLEMDAVRLLPPATVGVEDVAYFALANNDMENDLTLTSVGYKWGFHFENDGFHRQYLQRLMGSVDITLRDVYADAAAAAAESSDDSDDDDDGPSLTVVKKQAPPVDPNLAPVASMHSQASAVLATFILAGFNQFEITAPGPQGSHWPAVFPHVIGNASTALIGLWDFYHPTLPESVTVTRVGYSGGIHPALAHRYAEADEDSPDVMAVRSGKITSISEQKRKSVPSTNKGRILGCLYVLELPHDPHLARFTPVAAAAASLIVVSDDTVRYVFWVQANVGVTQIDDRLKPVLTLGPEPGEPPLSYVSPALERAQIVDLTRCNAGIPGTDNGRRCSFLLPSLGRETRLTRWAYKPIGENDFVHFIGKLKRRATRPGKPGVAPKVVPSPPPAAASTATRFGVNPGGAAGTMQQPSRFGGPGAGAGSQQAAEWAARRQAALQSGSIVGKGFLGKAGPQEMLPGGRFGDLKGTVSRLGGAVAGPQFQPGAGFQQKGLMRPGPGGGPRFGPGMLSRLGPGGGNAMGPGGIRPNMGGANLARPGMGGQGFPGGGPGGGGPGGGAQEDAMKRRQEFMQRYLAAKKAREDALAAQGRRPA
eukprot:jgi/Mesvir1/6155/Mv00853-RA.1